MLTKWTTGGSTGDDELCTIVPDGGRWGAGCARIGYTGVLRKNLGVTRSRLIFGHAWKTGVMPSEVAQGIVTLLDTGVANFTVCVTPLGEIGCLKGTGGAYIALSDQDLVRQQVWNYIETDVTGAMDGSGAIDIYLNNQRIIHQTGIQTCLSTSNFNQFQIDGTPNLYGPNYFCDLYVLDANGTKNNARKGNTKVGVIRPNGDGTYSMLVPSAAGPLWLMVKEIPPDDDTSYISSATPGDIATFTMENLASDDRAIWGFQECVFIKKGDISDRKYKSALTDGTTTVYGTERALGDTYNYWLEPHDDYPIDNTDLSPAKLNGLQGGIIVTL